MNEKEYEAVANADDTSIDETPKIAKQPEQQPEQQLKQQPEQQLKQEVKTTSAPAAAAAAAAKNAAVSGNAVDDVLLSQCVYKNMFARKSLTVHHVQRRLVEYGYRDAGSDKDGWYGDLTKSAIAEFQKAHNLEGAGVMNAATLVALFNGDPNVRVVA